MVQLVAPLPSLRSEDRKGVRAIVASVALLALALGCVALIGLDNGALGANTRSFLAVAGASQPDTQQNAAADRAAAAAVQAQVQAQIASGADPNAMAAATKTRGSIPTDTIEAAIIVGQNGKELETNMGKPYGDGAGELEERGHTNPTAVADAIIDFANKANEDKTGLRGANYYKGTVESATHPEFLTGSLPTYRAESKFITSGIVGNYEKALENSVLTKYAANPHVNPRTVAGLIIDSAVDDNKDCTGSVNGKGIHGVGRPPCPKPEEFDNQLRKITTTIAQQAPTP